ncbi:MAG: hypothetical protein JO266_05215 [Acidobacteria bacterium]|nr:hypothetical protein [Acidobacteriota bacterium]MBV8891365.1 hypothetical protein [Acidobacteriota bacterium]
MKSPLNNPQCEERYWDPGSIRAKIFGKKYKRWLGTVQESVMTFRGC